MTHPERYTIIERYIDGTMSPDERREFLDRLDHDEAMRAALHAEALITTAIRSDRGATPGPSAASRTKFLTMLASLPEPNAPLSGADAVGTGKGTPTGGGIAASGLSKAIVTTVVGVALTIGAVMMIPRQSPSPAPVPIERPSQAETAPAPQPQANAPERSVTNMPEQTAGQQPAETEERTAREQTSTGARHEKTRTAPARTALEGKAPTRTRNTAEEKTEKVVNEQANAQVNVKAPIISK